MRADRRLFQIIGGLVRAPADAEDAGRRDAARDILGIVYGGLLASAGLLWLAAATDPGVVRESWPALLLLLALALLLNRHDFFWIVERRSGAYDRWSASLVGLVTVSALLVFGPSAIWLSVLVALSDAARGWRAAALRQARLGVIRTTLLYLSSATLGGLLALALYARLGGALPLAGFSAGDAPRAALAVLALFGFDWLCWACYLLIAGWMRPSRVGALELGLFAAFELVAYLPEFFAILAAAVYVQMGLGAYLALIAGALLVNLLAHRLSQAAERNGQRSRELAQLEALGRALIAAAPDGSDLPALLTASAPRMFRAEQVEARLLPGPALLQWPADAPPAPEAAWEWLRGSPQPLALGTGEPPPWNARPAARPLAVAPILAADTGALLGGVFVRFSPTVQDPAESLPALQSLAAQIASARERAAEYARALAHEKVVQELAMAAEIQASFLPESLPALAGWQLAATLRPARQTSGDYYDVIELPGGRLGLVIADVADKGTGAALYMALSRTLLRTYALEYPERPEKALYAANKRLLLDSRSSMFVTVFYGILDPADGTLRYVNAGHNPPLLLHGPGAPLMLRNTGIPLGVMHGAAWATEAVTLAPGGRLVLYTDGVSEAQDAQGEPFDMARLVDAAREGDGAQAAQAAILSAVARFVGDAPQHDDITLLVVTREA